MACLLVGCGPSQKEVELQSQLDELKDDMKKLSDEKEKEDAKVTEIKNAASAILKAYLKEDFITLANLSISANKQLFNELIKEGPNHGSYNSIFKGWRIEAVRKWNGQDDAFMVASDEKNAAVKFLEIENEAIVVLLEKENGTWLFEDINSPNVSNWDRKFTN